MLVRRVLPWVWVYLFVLQIVLRNGVVILYSQFQEEIASRYCENRFSKQKECKGKCYLQKQIEESTSQHPSPTHLKLSKLEVSYFYEEVKPYLLAVNLSSYSILTIYSLSEQIGIHPDFTPPPRA